MAEMSYRFAPALDAVAGECGPVAALVWGAVWRYCRMGDGVCRASQARIARRAGLCRATVNRNLRKLVDAGYLAVVSDPLGRTHTYADTGRATAGKRSHVPQGEPGTCDQESQPGDTCDSQSHPTVPAAARGCRPEPQACHAELQGGVTRSDRGCHGELQPPVTESDTKGVSEIGPQRGRQDSNHEGHKGVPGNDSAKARRHSGYWTTRTRNWAETRMGWARDGARARGLNREEREGRQGERGEEIAEVQRVWTTRTRNGTKTRKGWGRRREGV